jgi:hypothetical protein
VEPATKFDIFHQRHVGKSAYVKESSSPAEYPVIAAAHSQQNSCVMSKAVRESINHASRQANSEVTANDIRIIHDARDLIQTLQWQFRVDMDKPKNLPARGARANIHLPGTTGIARDKLITKPGSEPICAIGASAVCNNDLRFRRSLAKVLKKWSDQSCLVEYRNNDGELGSNTFFEIACQMAIMQLDLCWNCQIREMRRHLRQLVTELLWFHLKMLSNNSRALL